MVLEVAYRFLKLFEELVCLALLCTVYIGLHSLESSQDWGKGLGAVGGHGGL
jgi:hypothetical protein